MSSSTKLDKLLGRLSANVPDPMSLPLIELWGEEEDWVLRQIPLKTFLEQARRAKYARQQLLNLFASGRKA